MRHAGMRCRVDSFKMVAADASETAVSVTRLHGVILRKTEQMYMLRCVLLCDITRRRVVVTTFRDNISIPISIGCPETSVRGYHSALRDIPEGRISHLLCGGSLKSPVNMYTHISYHISVSPQPHVETICVRLV